MPSEYEDQILIGTKIEEEHRATYEWLKQCWRDDVMPSAHALFYHIALDHLKERQDYYTILERAHL